MNLIHFVKRHWFELLVLGFFIWTLWKLDAFGASWETVKPSNLAFNSTPNAFLDQSRYLLPLEENAIKNYAKSQSDKFGINWDSFNCLINCESQYKENAIGDGGLAYGLLQFHKPTFYGYCQGEYTNSYDQISCAAEMISNKGLSHWKICGNKCFK